MGDDCCNPDSMGRVSELIKAKLGDTFVYSVQVGDTINEDHKAGFFGKIDEQVAKVCKELSEIPELQDGFNAIGFSQVSRHCSSSNIDFVRDNNEQFREVYF
jgi:palmitoyl-protein thioesterase